MQGEYKLSDEQSPLASNDLLCLHLRFDDVWFRALYKCDHLVTFSLRGVAEWRIVGGMRRTEQEASGSLWPEKGVRNHCLPTPSSVVHAFGRFSTGGDGT